MVAVCVKLYMKKFRVSVRVAVDDIIRVTVDFADEAYFDNCFKKLG